MKLFRTSLASAIVLSLTLWSAQSASAAQTRTLPTGNVLYAVDDNTAIGKVFTVDPLTSTPTSLSSSAAISPCSDSAFQAAFNPANGKGYILCWNSPRSDLYEVNLSTGASTLIGNVRDSSASDIGVISMAIDASGNAFILDSNSLYPLNLSTGVVGASIGASSGWNPGAFAYNPVDQQFYVINNTSTTNAQLYKINVSTGARTLLVNNAGFPITGTGSNKKVYAIAFDSNGTLWGVNLNLSIFSAVVTGTNAADFASSIQIGSAVGNIDTYTLFVQNVAPAPVPAPAPAANPTLANTGFPFEQGIAYAGAAAAFLLGGVLLTRGSSRLHRVK
jgi:hypothetical protein